MTLLFGGYMWMFWLVIIVVFIEIEATTVGLQAIWFAVGALAALVASLFHAPAWLQLILFLLGAVIQMIITPPIPSHFSNRYFIPDLAAVLGMQGVIENAVSPDAPGEVNIGGKVFPAVVRKGEVAIEPGVEVVVCGFDGESLVVELI